MPSGITVMGRASPKNLFVLRTSRGRRSSIRKTSFSNVFLPTRFESVVLVLLRQPDNSRIKGARLVFSPREALLLIEQARKNAETAPFNSNYGAGSRTRTYEGRSREIYSLLSLPLDDSSNVYNISNIEAFFKHYVK